MGLDEKIVLLRKEKGLSQLKVAEELGVSRQAISRWEVGAATPSTENLKCLGELFGVPVDYLLDKDSEWPCQKENDKEEELEQVPERRDVKRKISIVLFLILMVSILAYMKISKESEGSTPIEEMDGVQWETSAADEFAVDW